MKEIRVYVLNGDEWEGSRPDDMTKEEVIEFIKQANDTGYVYSLDSFETVFNNNTDTSTNNFILIR